MDAQDGNRLSGHKVRRHDAPDASVGALIRRYGVLISCDAGINRDKFLVLVQ